MRAWLVSVVSLESLAWDQENCLRLGWAVMMMMMLVFVFVLVKFDYTNNKIKDKVVDYR